MMTGKDPGELGIYGFHAFSARRPDRGAIATASRLKEPRLWDLAGRMGRRVVSLGVPQTYPPSQVNGWLVSGPLTPTGATCYTYPQELGAELANAVGPYQPDVTEYRTEDRAALLQRIMDHVDNRFDAADYLASHKDWDLFVMVDMSLDRLHHGFWRFADPNHPRFDPMSPFSSAVRQVYEQVDRRVGQLVGLMPDDTAVLVVSDHGAQPLVGVVAINQWLVAHGYLSVHNPPSTPTPLAEVTVDWEKTQCWATGGYCARLFLNLIERDGGALPDGDRDVFLQRLEHELNTIEDGQGRSIGATCIRPEKVYRNVRGNAPDLLIYFGDLAWRAAGTVGWSPVTLAGNDSGPDDANHHHDGVIIMRTGEQCSSDELVRASIYDIAPTVLDLLGMEIPDSMQGRSLV